VTPLPARATLHADWRSLARRHWLFALIFALGTTLRALAWSAYQPALFYSDSTNYLANMHRVPNVAWHPPGYPWFLDATLIGRHIAIVTAVQHLLLLGDGLVIYLLLLRLGCGRIVSALASAPLLLDAYQVQIEQYILSEALFETLLVAAIATALWRDRSGTGRLGVVRVAVAAAFVGLGVLVRLDAVGLVLPLLVWVVWAARRCGVRWLTRAAIAIALAIVAPLGVVMGLHGSGRGASITGSAPIWLYARVAGFAVCSHDSIPANERALCPVQPVGHRPGPVWFQDSVSSPVWLYLEQNPGHTAEVVSFARRVILHQPLDYAHAIGADFAQQFRPTRAQTPGGPEVRSWQFRLTLAPVDPTKPRPQQMVDYYGTGQARIDVGIARVLHDYQRFVYLPGPVSAVILLCGLVVLVVRRRNPLAPALLLVLGCAVLTVLTATATVLFSWRYMLPTLVFYPPAGALGWTMLRTRAVSRSSTPPELALAAP